MLMMETYRQSKDLAKALQTGKDAVAKYPTDVAIRATYAMVLGENQQADEGVKLLQGDLKGTPGDREVYLNMSQIYERSRHYSEAEAMARKAEAIQGNPPGK